MFLKLRYQRQYDTRTGQQPSELTNETNTDVSKTAVFQMAAEADTKHQSIPINALLKHRRNQQVCSLTFGPCLDESSLIIKKIHIYTTESAVVCMPGQ